MDDPRQQWVRNKLLRAMRSEDFDALRPHLRDEATEIHQSLVTPHVPIKVVFFPESGFASLTASGAGRTIEVGLIGFEGLVGAVPILLHVDQTVHAQVVQAAGRMYAVDVTALRRVMDDSQDLTRLLLRFVHVLSVQSLTTTFASVAFGLETRLARWLLMCHDRVEGDELTLTHEFLAMMIGVQRTSVTLSLQVLEGDGDIRARRGRITIRDRQALLDRVGDGYGVPEAEYRRVFGTG